VLGVIRYFCYGMAHSNGICANFFHHPVPCDSVRRGAYDTFCYGISRYVVIKMMMQASAPTALRPTRSQEKLAISAYSSSL
jgi:hypothetical protein